jgi:hypothetical protein
MEAWNSPRLAMKQTLFPLLPKTWKTPDHAQNGHLVSYFSAFYTTVFGKVNSQYACPAIPNLKRG